MSELGHREEEGELIVIAVYAEIGKTKVCSYSVMDFLFLLQSPARTGLLMLHKCNPRDIQFQLLVMAAIIISAEISGTNKW